MGWYAQLHAADRRITCDRHQVLIPNVSLSSETNNTPEFYGILSGEPTEEPEVKQAML